VSEKTLSLGIIGCGWITCEVHLPCLDLISRVRVAAACDVEESRLAAVRSRFGIRHTTTVAGEIFADPAIDAVLVATPADSHPRLALSALEAGKHVLVEKPLALTAGEAESLVRAAEASSRVAMTGLNFRFHPVVEELARHIARGDIGRPVGAHCTMMSAVGQKEGVTGYEKDPSRGGGVVHDKGVHVIDLVRFLMESEVARCRSIVKSDVHPHDFASFCLLLESGALVTGQMCDRAISECSVQVFGDEGKAEINLSRPAGVSLYRRRTRGKLRKILAHSGQALRSLDSALRLSTRRGRLASYLGQWEVFLDAVRCSTPARPDFEDGLAAARVVEALLISSETGREVVLGQRKVPSLS